MCNEVDCSLCNILRDTLFQRIAWQFWVFGSTCYFVHSLTKKKGVGSFFTVLEVHDFTGWFLNRGHSIWIITFSFYSTVIFLSLWVEWRVKWFGAVAMNEVNFFVRQCMCARAEWPCINIYICSITFTYSCCFFRGYESGSGTGGCSGLFCWNNTKPHKRERVGCCFIYPFYLFIYFSVGKLV